MFSFDSILSVFTQMFTALYDILDGIYLFEEFHVSVFWMLMGLVVVCYFLLIFTLCNML